MESTNEVQHTPNHDQQNGNPHYLYVDPSSLDPHLASMLSQFPPGTPIPESLLLQMGYDHILPGHQVNEYADDHLKQKLTEIEKFEDHFNGTEAVDINGEGCHHDNAQAIGDQTEGYETTNLEESYGDSTSGKVVHSDSENQCEPGTPNIDQEENHTQIDLEQQRWEREQKRKENLKPIHEDPEKMKEVIKTRNDFFAQFEQLRLEAEKGEESCENEEDENDITDVNLEEDVGLNYDYSNMNNQYEERCDSNQLFNQVDGDLPCENAEEEDYEENLDVHRQRFDNYQIIAREMSDENGKVVGELVDTEQRPFEGELSENENSFRNNFETVSVGHEQVKNNSSYANNDVNMLPGQFAQSNFPWQLQRRSEATEGECYV